MADVYPMSAPCLLDDLMDSGVITCDVDFGTADPVFAVKGSPSHESDSGCSDMSEEVRSVSPEVEHGQIGFPELEDLDCDEFSNSCEDELESYLNSPAKLRQKSDEGLRFIERPLCPVLNFEPSSPVIEVDTDSDPEFEPPNLRKVDSRKVLHTPNRKGYIPTPAPKADLCVLPRKSAEEPQSSKERPAVKIVKVIKAPVSSTNEELGSQLIQALDERNKKNAKQAKINREKKKMYIKSLEGEIDELKEENKGLKEFQKTVVNERNALEEEVNYLKSVLANQSALSGLLQNIGNVKGVKLSSSYLQKRSADMDHDYHSTKKRKFSTAGVCLHVDDGNVSLEFCSKCASMAQCSESDAKKKS